MPDLHSSTIDVPTPIDFRSTCNMSSIGFSFDRPELANIVRATLKSNPRTTIIGLLGSAMSRSFSIYLYSADFGPNRVVALDWAMWDVELIPSGHYPHLHILQGPTPAQQARTM